MRTFALLCWICVYAPSWAQEHIVFSPINSIHGLSDNRVRTVCQLTDGRMVIVTEGLVNIYDGANFHYMHYNEQKAYHLREYKGYHRAYIDNQNQLWLKHQQKLMLFDIRKERFVPNLDSVFYTQGIENKVVDLFMDTDFNFWFVSEENELLLKENESMETRIFLSDLSKATRFNDDLLYDVAILDKQIFLFFKSGVMNCYDMYTGHTLYSENLFEGTENRYSKSLMVVPHKQYLYQARNGNNIGQLVRFNTLNRKWERMMETDYWLNTLTIDLDGNCWISSLLGLWQIDENLRYKRMVSPLHLVDGRIFDSEICTQFNDNQGGLWVGTVNRGVLYYHPDRFKFRNIGHSLFNLPPSESISIFSIAEKEGQMLVGTQRGLFRYNESDTKMEPLGIIPANSHCEMLYKDSQNRMWICTRNNGLYSFDGQKNIHYKNPSHCIYIFEAFDGRLFLCTGDGPGIFDPQAGIFEKAKLPNDKSIGLTYQLTDYRQDTLLGYSDQGLFLYSMRSNTVSFPEKDSKILQHHNYHYHCLYTDSRGLIWLGTMDGLYVFNTTNQITTSFHQEEGLVNNSIRSVIEDHKGRIWVSTSNGISCIELTPDNNNYHFRFVNYNRFDGVIENEFLPRSAIKTNSGRLLWGGLDGFNEIDLTQIEKPKQRLYVPLFTRFTLGGTEVKMGEKHDGKVILDQSITTVKEIKLKHFQNFFSIGFSALNYINPTQTHYRYQLEGVDASWREIKSNDGIGRAVYTNLSHGTYRLKVHAATYNQPWDERFAEITIVITPPYWQTRWAYLSYLVLFIGLVYFILSSSIRRNIKKNQKRQREELDQMKFKFFTNISHELRTPLTLIITPLDTIIRKLNDEPLKTQLKGISRNATELLNLVNQLLAFRKLEMKGETLNLGYCNMREFMEAIVPPYFELAHENEVIFEYKGLESDLFLYVDQDKLRKITNNLLSNAFKFTPKNGRIQMKVLRDENAQQVIVQVSDTGCGISLNEKVQIFDRFYQAKNQLNHTGSGIGLHLVKEYVELHNGTVSVESQINEGSVFTVVLPNTLKPHNQSYEPGYENEINNATKILVVEDHKEFRTFLTNELSEKYQVITASNGKEGLEKAKEKQPDLIISDVMMPIMTGTEFCQQLKSDLQVSHIPIILLTAKASDEAQIEGFEAGADAYIAKPFNMEILLLRIQNLIEQQSKRKELFKKSIIITPSSLAMAHVDEEMINKVLQQIEANLDNTSYSVEQLSKDMNMDRTGLYRKLTAITGQTPTEFIRSVRLKKAAQLLQSGLPVSEVADRVGYGTLSYFSKCFLEEFGVKPSNYRHQKIK